MADSDQVTTHYVWETVRGVTPNNPALRRLRVTSPDISLEPEHTESAELNAHRQSTDFTLVGLNVGGTIGLEISYGNADEWIEAVMCGTWGRKANASIASCTTSAFTVGATAPNFKKGMVVRVASMLNAANNGLFVLAADGSGTTVGVAGLTAEASAPGGATMTCLGFQGAAADLQAVTAGGNALTISSTSGDFTALGLQPGEWVKIGGAAAGNQFATAACNGWARISAITATRLSFDIVPAGWAADTGTGKSIRLTFGDRLVPGAVRRSATVQNRMNDTSPITYQNSRGQEAGSLALELRPRDQMKATLTLMGDDGDYEGAIAGQTDVAAPTNDVMNTGADLGRVALDGVVAGSTADDFVQSLSLTIDNRMRNRAALGKRGYAGRGLGKLSVEGQIDMYLANKNVLAKSILNQDFQADFRVADAAGRTILMDLPSFKLAANPRIGGTGQDTMVSGRIKARRHVTLGYPLMIQRYSEVL